MLRIHCGVEVTELRTNKQLSLSTFSHFLIVNKTSLFLSLPPSQPKSIEDKKWPPTLVLGLLPNSQRIFGSEAAGV